MGHDDHQGHSHAHHDHDHDRGHSHGHAHVHAPASFGRAFAIGITLNVVFVGAEWALGLAADSLALLADAAHNLGDVLSLLLAWLATRLAQRLPTARYTYGLRASSILAALVNAIVLMLVTGGLAWEAIQRLHETRTVDGVLVAATAFGGVLVNGITAWLFMKGSRDDLNIRAAYLHMASDAAVSVVVAVSGIVVMFTAWHWLDPVLTLAVSAFIVYSTWDLLAQSLRLALQAVPASIDANEVRGALAGLPGVADVHDLHIWAMSTTENALTAHLVMPHGHPGDAFLQSACHQLSERFGIRHATLQVEVGDTATTCALAPEHVV